MTVLAWSDERIKLTGPPMFPPIRSSSYDARGARLALYPIEPLSEEAAPGEALPAAGWNGITLAMNLDDRPAVDAELDRAVAAGAKEIARPVEREWGGYSGYVADPEGHRWEIAWAPD